MDEVDRAQIQSERTLNAAIARATGNIYGHGRKACEDCGDDIPAARRAANPAATRCIDCQSVYEKRMKRA